MTYSQAYLIRSGEHGVHRRYGERCDARSSALEIAFGCVHWTLTAKLR